MARSVVRQDTYDLREQILGDDHHIHAHADAVNHYGTDDEEHSVLEDDSDGEDQDDYMDDDDDGSSSLSIPNESIDFDLVYAFHSFAATVDGQANVVKGDSLFLMDDSNSYWWLVRVLKTQEVGYIPAENIETPFERLARLNKHRNVDLASATQQELQDGLNASQDRLRNNLAPSPRGRKPKGIRFTPTLSVHRYLPAVWKEDEMSDEEDVEWDDEGYEDEDEELALEQMQRRREEEANQALNAMEPEDPMKWDDKAAAARQQQPQQQIRSNIPEALLPGAMREQQQQAALRAQQQQQQQLELQREEALRQQQMQQQQMDQQQTLQRQQQSQFAEDSAQRIDPLDATETRKLTVTPTIAREDDRGVSQPLMPSAIINQQQDEERAKRLRDEEEDARKRAKGKDKTAVAVSSASPTPAARPSKLRKEPSKEKEDEDGKKKKKSGGIFGIFRGKSSKKPDNASMTSLDSGDMNGSGSDESSRIGTSRVGPTGGALSPTSTIALQQQQSFRINESPQASATQTDPSTPERPSYSSSLRQRDQQHQALYQQYLNRSPSSPPEAQPSYALQSASFVIPPTSSSSSSGLGPPVSRPRPGSLILTPAGLEGPTVPDLSVIRVFAGDNLQTEATFKTVLLNSNTSSSDLVRQAIQRFRLPAGEDADDYYLTIKRVEGGTSAVLLPEEHPLAVFENLVAETMELPKVKRSSVGSISSVSSDLSMHPAISKLPMNDFSDDSAVKFYLNRRGDNNEDNFGGQGGDDTLIADTSLAESTDSTTSSRSQYLTVNVAGANVTAERFTSPSFRFALQLVIYPEDLPDDMVFHPTTEAIVFKDSLSNATSPTSPSISAQFRRKVFMFPKNVTVAEVIELGLERFGILEGVVDGGDEVEDKFTKRRSSNRVRYGLVCDTGDGRERELPPSTKVTDAYPRPPVYRNAERHITGKRRSLDAGHLLGSLDDVHPNDPVFILRRAVSYRTSTSRHRTSAPLDEIALANFHRESASIHSQSDASSPIESAGLKQPSRQEIIAAQRAATRANQRALLSAQSNSVRGMDVLLPGNAVLRSSRYDANDRMRYSYVEPDGETYDISDIVEEEWRESNSPTRGDLLEGVLAQKDALGDKLDRVLNKIKQEKGKERDGLVPSASRNSTARSISPSEYSDDGEGNSRAVTPGSAGFNSKMPSGNNNTSTRSAPAVSPTSRRNPSIASVMSDASGYATATSVATITNNKPSKPSEQKPLVLPKDDFGISHMMAIIDYKSSRPKKPSPPPDPVDKLLFGVPMDLESLHPQVREIYASSFKQLEEIDKMLDNCIRPSVSAF
ncbi:hypothetical protein FA15DRAFT_619644 [Coprinopsis marcescibilis]|uniref:SH3 domain-containing protein n=1 Tax=Coprinopsis marcescibilis TaxID=230819 RepID=A0A5C3KUU7_COPMA|nr:hypothetical protein FA15DRAFT_619644 [Coprinopsis marcescibilis]